MSAVPTIDQLRAVRAGDQVATAEVWRSLNPSILRYLRARNCPEVDDVAAQVWLEVARNLAGFEGDGEALRRWVFTLAHRRLLDAVRARSRRWEDASDDIADLMATTPAPDDDDELETAIELVRQLPAAQADAVLLRFVGGLSPEEVGQIMDRSPGAVRVLTHRGLSRLRRQLAPARVQAHRPGTDVPLSGTVRPVVTPVPVPALTTGDD